MPFPNEHACRLLDPGGFRKDTFRRKKSGKVSLIMAKKPGSDTMTLQSIRYPISDWTEKAAKASCKKKGGAFEAASKEEKIVEISAEELLELAEQNPELADYELIEKALGEQEEVKEKRHSRKSCMSCKEAPTKEVLWAEGKGHAWFCDEHFNSWSTEGDGMDEIISVKEVKDGKASGKFADNTNPNIWPELEKETQEVAVEEEKAVVSKFFTVKGKDRDYWVALSGSAFKDREDEIVSRRAIDYGIKHGDDTGQRGELRLYHYPGSKVGECEFQMRVKNFLIEAGPWDDSIRAKRAMKWVEENEAGVSVGFFYNPKKFIDGVYKDEVIFFERSVLKKKHASCPYTDAKTISGRLIEMSHKKDLVEMIGEEETKAILEGAKDASKDLEKQGVAFKEENQEKTLGEGLLEQVKKLSEGDLKALYALAGKLLKVEEKEVEEKEVKEEVVGEKQEDKEKQVEAPEEVQFRLDDAAIKAIAEAVKEMLPDNSKLEAEIAALKEATESASKVLTEQVETKVKEVFEDLPKATIYRATKVTEEEPKEEPGTAWVNPLERSLEDGIREIEKAREAGR